MRSFIVLKRAIKIAKNDLRACYAENGILAGRGHFQQYWARDSFFSSLGATAIGDFEIVEKQFRFFLEFIKSNGALPGLITASGRPVFRPLILSSPVDGNALFLISLAEFLQKSGNAGFVERNFNAIKKAMEWLEGHDLDKDGLIEEGLLANWADSVLKFWKVLYSNCCYCYALEKFSEIASAIGKKKIALQYEKKAKKTKMEINKRFWLKEHYADWIDFRKHKNFSSDGNVLAIAWNIAGKKQAKAIEKFVEKKKLTRIPMRSCWPNYPFWRIASFFAFPSKAYYYHNGLNWLWLGAMNVIALLKISEKKKALLELEKISRLIVENKTVHEIFDSNGKPVDSLLLKSEHPFAWSSALFLLASKKAGIA